MKKLLKNLIAIAFAMFIATGLSAADKKSLENKILFVDKVNGGTCLFVMDPDGSNKRPLTPAKFDIVLPKYNKKTGEVAFTNHTDQMVSEIYILDKNGKELTKVLTDGAFQDFSPDGKSFLYTTTGMQPSLFTYDMEKGQAIKISQSLKVCSANWSSDGRWIVVSAYTESGTLDMYMISCYGEGIHRTTVTPSVNEAFPMYSVDFNLVYFTNRYGQNEIEIMGAGKNDKMGLVRTGLKGTHPSFSPDGKFIVYQDGRNIIVSDLRGTNPKIIGTGTTPYWTK